MDSTQRRSYSPMMANSQRMGLSRDIFAVPPDLETNRRLTRSIRNTSNEPMANEPRSPYDGNKPSLESDQLVFRQAQTYRPSEVQQSFQYKKPDYAESRSSRQQPIQQSSYIKTQYDFKPTNSYVPPPVTAYDFATPPDSKPYNTTFEAFKAPSEKPSYKPQDRTMNFSYQRPSEIPKPDRQGEGYQAATGDRFVPMSNRTAADPPLAYQAKAYEPPKYIDIDEKPSYRAGSQLNTDSMYKQSYRGPDLQAKGQDPLMSIKASDPLSMPYMPQEGPTPSYKPGDFQSLSYKPGEIGTTTYKPGELAQTSYKPGDLQLPYKQDPGLSFKSQKEMNQSYNPGSRYDSSYREKSEEWVIVESEKSEHEYQAQCNIF